MTKQLSCSILLAIFCAFAGFYIADITIDWYKSLGNLVTPKEVLGWYAGFIFFLGCLGFFIGGILFSNKK